MQASILTEREKKKDMKKHDPKPIKRKKINADSEQRNDQLCTGKTYSASCEYSSIYARHLVKASKNIILSTKEMLEICDNASQCAYQQLQSKNNIKR